MHSHSQTWYGRGVPRATCRGVSSATWTDVGAGLTTIHDTRYTQDPLGVYVASALTHHMKQAVLKGSSDPANQPTLEPSWFSAIPILYARESFTVQCAANTFGPTVLLAQVS